MVIYPKNAIWISAKSRFIHGNGEFSLNTCELFDRRNCFFFMILSYFINVNVWFMGISSAMMDFKIWLSCYECSFKSISCEVRLLQSYKPRYKHGGAIPCQYDQYGGTIQHHASVETTRTELITCHSNPLMSKYPWICWRDVLWLKPLHWRVRTIVSTVLLPFNQTIETSIWFISPLKSISL